MQYTDNYLLNLSSKLAASIERVRELAEHYINSSDETLRLIGIAILEEIIGAKGKYGEQ